MASDPVPDDESSEAPRQAAQGGSAMESAVSRTGLDPWDDLGQELLKLTQDRPNGVSLTGEFVVGRVAVAFERLRNQFSHQFIVSPDSAVERTAARKQAHSNGLDDLVTSKAALAADEQRLRIWQARIEETRSQAHDARKTRERLKEELKAERETWRQASEKYTRRNKETALRTQLCHRRLKATEDEVSKLQLSLAGRIKNAASLEGPVSHSAVAANDLSEAWNDLVGRMETELELAVAEAADAKTELDEMHIEGVELAAHSAEDVSFALTSPQLHSCPAEYMADSERATTCEGQTLTLQRQPASTWQPIQSSGSTNVPAVSSAAQVQPQQLQFRQVQRQQPWQSAHPTLPAQVGQSQSQPQRSQSAPKAQALQQQPMPQRAQQVQQTQQAQHAQQAQQAQRTQPARMEQPMSTQPGLFAQQSAPMRRPSPMPVHHGNCAAPAFDGRQAMPFAGHAGPPRRALTPCAVMVRQNI